MLFGWGLIFLLSLVMSISTFLPRTPQDMVSFSQGNGSALLDLLFKIGIYDNETFQLTLVNTWWFKALVFLILLYLLKAVVRSVKDFGSFKNHPASNLRVQYNYRGSEQELRSFLIYNLEKLRFKVQAEPGDIIALRGKAFSFSIIIIHLGLLFAILGGIYSYSKYEKGSIYLPQGVRVSTQQLEGVEVNENIELEAENLWPQYYSIDEFEGSYNGLVKDYFANLKIYSGQDQTSVVASTSENIKIGQHRFFLTDFGATGVIAIKNGAGKESLEVFPVEYKQGSLLGSYITNENIGLSINYSGIPNKDGKESFSYQIYEYTANGWQQMAKGEQKLFEPISYKGKEYIFKDINRVAQFTVVKTNPAFMYSGLITFLIGLILFLFSKKIKLRISFSIPQQLVIEGWGMPDKLQLHRQLKRLSEQMGWEEI